MTTGDVVEAAEPTRARQVRRVLVGRLRSLPVIRSQALGVPGRAARSPAGAERVAGQIAVGLDSPDDADALALTFAQRVAPVVDPNVIPLEGCLDRSAAGARGWAGRRVASIIEDTPGRDHRLFAFSISSAACGSILKRLLEAWDR